MDVAYKIVAKNDENIVEENTESVEVKMRKMKRKMMRILIT